MCAQGGRLPSAAPERRGLLISAARHCLRDPLANPSGWDADVVDARLRTLVHLGGTLGRDAIVKALTTQPIAPRAATRAIEALCDLDPREAATLVLARAHALRAGGVRVTRALRRTERRGALPRGFAGAWARARDAIARRIATSADAWLVELTAAWRDRAGVLPSAALLDAIAAHPEIPNRPLELLDHLADIRDLVRGTDHLALARRLATERDLLQRLLVGEPARI